MNKDQVYAGVIGKHAFNDTLWSWEMTVVQADPFSRQYAEFTQYPTNLIFTTTYQRDLDEYKDALLSNQTLCITNEEDLDVGFRDFHRATDPATGSVAAPATRNAVNAQDATMFRGCLGDQSHTADQNGNRGRMVTQPDPVCRFMYVSSQLQHFVQRLADSFGRSILLRLCILPRHFSSKFFTTTKSCPAI
jgi:S-methylmethionine-dependent homocysteine/selenocysteine methylase